MSSANIYFADTSFWVALLIGSDAYHARALLWRGYVKANRYRLCTTVPVMWELLNSLSAVRTRGVAASVYRQCLIDQNTEMVDAGPASVEFALQMYEARSDKEWSLTDCHSFRVMQDRAVRAALSSDKHFEQAGFSALLLSDPPAA